MTDQPTAPQTWDTLPDDPDAIPFPIVVGWKVISNGLSVDVRNRTELEGWINLYGNPDWWMPWPTFAPDPMTVNQWHDMALLPDEHDERVWIEYEDGSVKPQRGTTRAADAAYGRKRWRSEAAMLAHVGGTVEGE